MNQVASGFAVRLYDLQVRIAAGSPAIFDAVNRYLFPWLPRLPLATADETLAPPSLTFRMEDRASEIIIRREDDTEISAESIDTAVPLLQSASDEAVVNHSSDVAFVHAGVVAVGNAGILLPGVSHA